MTKRVIGYARVSTEEQGQEGISLDMQAAKIKAHCLSNPNLELVELIREVGSAKDIKGRPELKRALDMVDRGQADGIVVWKYDRAFRNTEDALVNGQVLMSVTEAKDDSPAGEFVYTLLSAVATMERRMIGVRTSAAMQHMKSEGVKFGTVPYGYDRTDDGKHLVENAKEQSVISQIRQARQNKISFRNIAKDLNAAGVKTKQGTDWTHVQVSRAISR